MDGDGRAPPSCERWSPGRHRLFAFPAQSNFSGVQHPLEWVDAGPRRADGTSSSTAPPSRRPTASTCRAVRPDFVPLSFYKMFGYPTGIGALVYPPRRACEALRRPWFAGRHHHDGVGPGRGLVPPGARARRVRGRHGRLPGAAGGRSSASPTSRRSASRRSTSASWRSPGGYSRQMTRLATRQRRAGRARSSARPTVDARGGTIAFYLLAPDGMPYDVRGIEDLATGRADVAAHRVLLQSRRRRGGPRHHARGLMATCFVARRGPRAFDECAETLRTATGRTPNTVRASLGLASNFADAVRVRRIRAGLPGRDVAATRPSRRDANGGMNRSRRARGNAHAPPSPRR